MPLAFIGVLASMVINPQTVEAAGAARPNIIIVMADDMGFSDLGSYGGEISTPAIDRLAKEGLRFSRFYNCAMCGPSRAALMTGCYPWKVGQAPGANIFANLAGNCVTAFELLKAGGYRTCAVGRLDMIVGDNWHNPSQIARSVDRCLGSASGGPGNYFKEAEGTPWFRDGERWKRPDGAYSTDLISGFVVDFIEEQAGSDQPFFIYVSHYAPHWPLQANEADIVPYRQLYQTKDRKITMQARLDRLIGDGLIAAGTTLPESALDAKPAAGGYLEVQRMAIHAAMVDSIDRATADMMVALKNAGKLDNTLVLVLSDNGASSQMVFDKGSMVPDGVRPGSGETFLNHGPSVAALSNTPFRNYKTSYYEGGIASPLVAWWPAGLKKPGRLLHRLSHIADIMPTCLELAGVSYPQTFAGRKLIAMDGKSFVASLRDQERDANESRLLCFAKALREEDWKLVLENPAQPELYNLAKDRNEQENLSARYPEKVRSMMTQFSKIGPQGIHMQQASEK